MIEHGHDIPLRIRRTDIGDLSLFNCGISGLVMPRSQRSVTMPKEAAMQTLQFGRKLNLPSTKAIKHQILCLMLEDHLKAQGLDTGPVEAATHTSVDEPSD
jgi:hypothetical protein